MEQTSGKESIWSRNFVLILTASLMLYIGQEMIQSLVTKYANDLGASTQIIGIIAGLYAAAAMIFKIFSGPTIDTFNRKTVAAIAMIGLGFVFAGYGFSNSIMTIMICRFLQGMCLAFTATCCLTLATDVLPKSKVGSGIGIFSLGQALASGIGPAISLWMKDVAGYRYTFGLTSVMLFAAGAITLMMRVEHKKTKKFKISLHNMFAKEAILPASVVMCLALVFPLINSYLAIYSELQGVPSSQIGLYYTVYACTLLFTRPVIGRLSDKYGTVKVAIPAIIFFACSFILISFANTLPMFLFAGFISGFGYGACMPIMQALSMKCVPAARRGAGSGTNYIGSDIGQMLGLVLAGTIITWNTNSELAGYISQGVSETNAKIYAELAAYQLMWKLTLIPILAAIIILFISKKRISRIEKEFLDRKD